MFTIFCSHNRKQNLVNSFNIITSGDLRFISSYDELQDDLIQLQDSNNIFFIEVTLFWEKTNFLNGIDLAKWLRRENLISAPIIFISSRKLEDFDLSQNGILQAKGSGLIPPRLITATLKTQLRNIKSLTDEELQNVVIKYCDLKDEWEKVSHKISGLLKNYKQNCSEIKAITKQWAESIIRFAPEHKESLGEFQTLLNKPIQSINLDELKQTKQNLDEALKGKKPYDFSEIDLKNLPRFPPKGFSSVLIADDEPLDLLISGLQNEYRYSIVGQAQGADEAARLLNEKKPGVVLSDYYFKKHTRDKSTDKKFGEEFMMLAARTNISSTDQTENPIVAVISKTSLDKLDIPAGVLDFSGSLNATQPEFVHRGIWVEAIKRGITEPEIVAGQKWTLDYHCRQRLEPYKSDLPKLIRQWDSFKDTIQETLDMNQNISAKNVEDLNIINNVKETLEPFINAKDFSLAEVTQIFEKIEKDHKKAKEPPESEVKTKIRNILHGKIEQFSSVTNHIRFTQKVFSKVSSDLILLPQFKQIGEEFKVILNSFKEDEPLMPFLFSFESVVNKALKLLPEIPKVENPFKAKNSVFKPIHILIAEDNKSWSETVKSAIEKVKLKLGDSHRITYEHYDNVTAALKAIPKITQTPAKKELEQIVKNIAVVDICLPEKNKKGVIPSPENGVKLIQSLSGYTSNVPLIVFSTKASLDDRQIIGKLGATDTNFIAKDYDAESKIIQSLISLIEKNEKYIIQRLPVEKNGTLFYEFLINNLAIPFPEELNTTFQALYELRESGDINDELLFTADEINIKRLQIKASEDSNQKNPIHDHINRMRKLIHETFQRNNRYIDTRELVKTTADGEGTFFYELKAELPSFDDEEFFLEGYENFRSQDYKVMVIGENDDISNQIADALRRRSETICLCQPSEDIESKAKTFRPDIIYTELENIESWKRVRAALPTDRLGIIVTTTNEEKNKNRLVEKAIKSGVPVANFVSINEMDWINSFLTKLNNEKQRVFLGKIDDSSQNSKEPIVEILKGSNLSEGKLRLRVNDESFTPSKSKQSKILGYLLQNPGTLINLDIIKRDVLGINKPVADNYLNKLVERIRTQIQENWLKTDDRDLTMQILDSSAKGMQLNVQVINSQDNK